MTPFRFPPALYRALDELNAGAYFACHETLEALWIPEKDAVRQIYQGVLQIAVGCYHLVERANWVGAVNKLDAGARRLEPWPAEMGGVSLEALIAAADRLQAHLRALGRDRIRDYDPTLLPKATYRAATE